MIDLIMKNTNYYHLMGSICKYLIINEISEWSILCGSKRSSI